jgi:hypothetical protein
MGVNEVHRVRQVAIRLVRCSRKVIHEHQPRQVLFALVRLRLRPLFLIATVSTVAFTGMGLPNKDIDKVHAVAVPGVELLQWRNSARGNWSGKAAETEDHWLAAQVAQAYALARGRLKVEVWSKLTRLHTDAPRRAPKRIQQMLHLVVFKIVLIKSLVRVLLR